MLNIDIIDNEKKMADAHENWNKLLEKKMCPNIFLTWEWIANCWENYNTEDRSLRILTVRENGSLIGIAPFQLVRKRINRVLNTNVLEVIGSDFGGDYLDFIIEDGNEGLVLESINEYIRKNKKIIDIISIPYVDGVSRSIEFWEKINIKNQKLKIWQSVLTSSPYLKLPSEHGDFEKNLNKNFRQNLRTSINRIKKECGDYLFGRAHTLDEQRNLTEMYIQLHQSRFIQKGQQGEFTSQNKKNFLYSLIDKFQSKGLLHIYYLNINGKARAILIGFLYFKKFYLLKITMDTEYGRYGVGQLLIYNVIKELIKAGAEEFDFLRGEETYKFRWATQRRHLYDFSISTSSQVYYLSYFPKILKCHIKKMLRKI